MNADGSNPVDLTNSPANESDPRLAARSPARRRWQPRPGSAVQDAEPARPEARVRRARRSARPAASRARVRYAPLEAPAGPDRSPDAAQGLRLCLGVRVNVVVSRGLR